MAVRKPDTKKVKTGTASIKSHRFKPFSQRIASIRIDPLHRVRVNHHVSQGDLTKSYFRASLEHWSDLNVSSSFVDFLKKIGPLCENLPQLLHHADRVNDLLLEYIEKSDVLSAEPLLNLFAQFAHDLGAGFEKYFLGAVSLVTSVASTHEAPEVIEWSFTCLTWIFKFLSKLLTPDLRPLLSIMLPYLGIARQKWFVSRFAAESMVFLIRKAAIQYQKNSNPLQNAVLYLFEASTRAGTPRETQAYHTAFMALLSEAIRGVSGNIHSSGTAIISCLFKCATELTNSGYQAIDIVKGILVSVLHQTTAEGALPIMTLVTDYAAEMSSTQDSKISDYMAIELMLVMSSTRKGSRIQNWKMFNSSVFNLLEHVASNSGNQDILRRAMILVAQTMSASPLDEILPFLSKTSALVLTKPFSQQFLFFCHISAELAVERFRDFVTPSLQDFVHLHWRRDEGQLLLLLLRLIRIQAIDIDLGRPGHIDVPSDWISWISDSIYDGTNDIRGVALLYARLELISHVHLTAQMQERISSALLVRIRQHLFSPPVNDSPAQLALGSLLQLYVKISQKLQNLDTSLRDPLCASMHQNRSSKLFLDGISDFFLNAATELDESDIQAQELVHFTTENLLGEPPHVKSASLRLLRCILGKGLSDVVQSIDLALAIMQTPYNLQTARRISLMVRKLQIHQKRIPFSSLTYKTMSFFLLGLLNNNLPSLSEDICKSINDICETKAGEEAVMPVVLRWLEAETRVEFEDATDQNEEGTKRKCYLTEFQCSNAESVEASAARCATDLNDPYPYIIRQLKDDIGIESPKHSDLRSIALRVLHAIPNVAEKWSRSIVPLFLTVFQENKRAIAAKEAQALPHCLFHSSWSLPNRRDLINLFTKFLNPKTLFRSTDVYQALLGIVADGNSELQRLALRAIYCWKSQAIRPYEELLLNLTEERKYREEIAKAFHSDNEASFVQSEHRSELMPILLRVLYGQAVARPGSHSNHADQSFKRRTILRILFRLHATEVEHFIFIALGPLAGFLPPIHGSPQSLAFDEDIVTQDRQHGLLNMIRSMLNVAEGQSNEFIESILNAVIYCLVRACRSSLKPSETTSDGIGTTNNLARRNRRLGLQCLISIFKYMPEIDWRLYLPVLFSEVVSPRLGNFPTETTQSVSGLLQLFATWASVPHYLPFFVDYESSLLEIVADCLVVSFSRDDVQIFVLDEIFTKMAQAASQDTLNVAAKESAAILQPHTEYIVSCIGFLLDNVGSGPVLESAINTLSALTPFSTSEAPNKKILASIPNLLSKPPGTISPKTKAYLLQLTRTLLSTHSLAIGTEIRNLIYTTVSTSFGHFKDDRDRAVLCDILNLIARTPVAKKVACLCVDLNARVFKKLDEVDHDRRLAAFYTIQEFLREQVTSDIWLPILHNLLFFALHADDLAVRTNTIACIKAYIEQTSGADDALVQSMSKKALLPALKRGLRERSETVRADHIGLLGVLISKCPDWPELSDMVDLLAHNDEEASFFNNVLHIQHHRRVRALRRLMAEIESGKVRSSNVYSIFLPLLERFVFDLEDSDKKHSESDNNQIVGPSIEAIRTLTAWTEWNQFRSNFLRYKSYLKSKPWIEKNIIKLLGSCADSLHHAVIIRNRSKSPPDIGTVNVKETPPRSRLSETIPSADKLASDMMDNFIPELTSFVHDKDESEISLRVPICITVAKLLVVLDSSQQALVLPPLLLDIAYILRSRSQDSRDIARKTLAQVVTILGPNCIPFVLKELRTALTRGYQLHVLSYTVHSILVANEDSLKPGDVDDCLTSLVAIMIDDIFGIAGQEKETEEYTRKPKEVKSSKSYDSMELVAKSVSLECLFKLLQPIQSLLNGKLTAKQARQVDELLRRIGLGLARNPANGSKEILILIYQMIQKFYSEQGHRESSQAIMHRVSESRFLVQRPASDETGGIEQTALHGKLMHFALDLLRSTLHKHEELCTSENAHGFVPVIGDALLRPNEEVKISAMRLLSSIIKLRLSELDSNAQLFISEATNVVRGATNTNSEAAQAALKLITAYIRERRQSTIRDSDLAYLLKRIIPDLEELDRQGVTFNFIKAVIGRQLVIPEVYELMDRIAAMMVTNHTRNARDVARGSFVYFLVEYPQSKSRWSKQLKFLIKNLEYKYPEGRQSVMEAVNVLLTRSSRDIAKDVVDAMFIPVVLITVNDESADCRNMAGVLLGQFFKKVDAGHIEALVTPVRSWLEQNDNTVLTVAGMQVFEVMLDVPELRSVANVAFLRSRISQIISTYDSYQHENTWETVFHALELFSRLCIMVPGSMMTQTCCVEWAVVAELLRYRHPWVQSTAAKLIGSWFHELARANSDHGFGYVPLKTTHGLRLDDTTMIGIMRSSLLIVKRSHPNKELTSQCIRNLVFLGRCFNNNNVLMPDRGNMNKDGSDQDDHDEKNDDDKDSELSGESTTSNSDKAGTTQRSTSKSRPAIHYLFHQLAFILHREPASTKSSSLTPKTSALRLLFALVHHTSSQLLIPILATILLPLAHLTDLSTPAPTSAADPSFSTTYASQITSAHEVLDSLQTKVETNVYVAAMTATRQRMRERREERRAKRRIERIASPERAERKKSRKNERKKERRKEKGREMRSMRRGW